MTWHEWARIVVMISTVAFAVLMCVQVYLWDRRKEDFQIRELFTALGKDKRQHISRAAVGEVVALFATTSGYLGTLAIKPETYETATLVYGGLWVVRGGYSTYLRSKSK